jgi:hypothetical protein
LTLVLQLIDKPICFLFSQRSHCLTVSYAMGPGTSGPPFFKD